MNSEQLFDQIRLKQSFLCIGLDTEMAKLPGYLNNVEFPLYEFNRQIIDSTHDLVIAYKPNVAFYECLGTTGWHQLELTVNYIREHYPDLLIIADAKRGDIGNTSKKYAETFFKYLNCDAVTVAPYMGSDSVLPFLEYPGKWVIILALTSNKGADDFQFLNSGNHERLFEAVIRKSAQWGNAGNMMYVVGATRASMLVKVREIIPNHFLLIPGVGAQGGDLAEVARYGFNSQCGLIVNSSRAIIYADSTERFAQVAREKALETQHLMKNILVNKGLLEGMNQ
jgi:orotidine-5'-phosphate decarboxylase